MDEAEECVRCVREEEEEVPLYIDGGVCKIHLNNAHKFHFNTDASQLDGTLRRGQPLRRCHGAETVVGMHESVARVI
jgi:hypothetical protein